MVTLPSRLGVPRQSTRPLLFSVKRVSADTTRDVNTLGVLGNDVKWSLDTVKDTFHNTWPQLYRQRLSSTLNRIPQRDTRSLLVTLNSRLVGLKFNDLPDQLFVAHTHQLVHSRSGHTGSDNDWTRNAEHLTLDQLAYAITITCLWSHFY